MNSSTSAPILNLVPPEILHKTLIYVSNPIDVLVNFSSTCRDFYEFCQISNSQLAKELFLVNFDPPSMHQLSGELEVYDYKEEMKRRTTALSWFKNEETRKSLQSTSAEILEVTLSTLIIIAKERLSTSYESLNSILLNQEITPDALASLRPPSLSRRQLRSSSLAAPPLPTSTLSLLSYLQVLSTPSPLTIHSPTQRTGARETVYSRKNFSKNSLYGPFKDDKSGNVDWNKVEALSIVMGCNLRDRDWDEVALNGGTAALLEIPKGWNSTREAEVGADGEKRDGTDQSTF